MREAKYGEELAEVEHELMRLRYIGYLDKAAADELVLSIRTIEHYGMRIKKKLGATTNFHCMAIYLQRFGVPVQRKKDENAKTNV